MPFDLDDAWTVHPQAVLRPEPFGALAYHYGTRRLSFLKDPLLADVVSHLGDHRSAREACAAAGVAPERLAAFAQALDALAASGMLAPRAAHRSSGGDAPAVPASTPTAPSAPASGPTGLTDRFERGLDAPICLTWELTYACNLACRHCLSSSGRRDPRELTTAECESVIDDLQRLQVFYVNVGGGEPTVRPDFWHLLDRATERGVGVKFSTNGSRITAAVARRLAASAYVDVQVSIDGATAEVNDAVRGPGSYDTALTAMRRLADAGFRGFKISVVATRHNIPQLDAFKALADSLGAQLRLTRLRPSGRGVDVWDELHPTAAQQRDLYEWLLAHGEDVLTGDSFFHLGAYGRPLPGLNLCGAGRVVCLIDPVGDVYACPFAIHEEFHAGNVGEDGGFERIWRESALFTALRQPQSSGACTSCDLFDSCRGGCMAAKFFTGLPLDGPDPECVRGFGAQALAAREQAPLPQPAQDHSRRTRSLPVVSQPPARACDEHPLAGAVVRGA